MKRNYGCAYVLSVLLVTSSSLAQLTDKPITATADGEPVGQATGGVWNFLYGQGMSSGQQTNLGLIEDFVRFSEDYTAEQSMTTAAKTNGYSDNSATEAVATQQHTDAENENADKISSESMPPEKFAEWLNSIEPEKTAETDSPANVELVDHFNPEEFPPDKFRNWLESKTPRPIITVETHQRVEKVNERTGLSRNMIIVISTAGGTACLCLILIVTVFCLKRKTATKSVDNDFAKHNQFTVKTVHPLSVTGKSSDLFMGIPANNEIWKDLQTLPNSSSNNSLSDSQKK